MTELTDCYGMYVFVLSTDLLANYINFDFISCAYNENKYLSLGIFDHCILHMVVLFKAYK